MSYDSCNCSDCRQRRAFHFTPGCLLLAVTAIVILIAILIVDGAHEIVKGAL